MFPAHTRSVCVRPTARILAAVKYLPGCGCQGMRVTQTICVIWAHGSKHTDDGNQILGVVELPEDAIVELEFSMDKKPTYMWSKMLVEAKLVEQINKYLYSSHKRDDLAS